MSASCWQHSEPVALNDSHIGVEHIALALTAIKQGLIPQILSEASARRRRCALRSSTGTGGRADRYLVGWRNRLVRSPTAAAVAA